MKFLKKASFIYDICDNNKVKNSNFQKNVFLKTDKSVMEFIIPKENYMVP